MQTSTRRAISYPSLDRTDRPDVPAHFYNLVQKLDIDVIYAQGTDAARIAASHQIQGGLLWWTTDTHLLWYDDGAAWWLVSTSLTGAVLLSLYDAKGDLIVGTGNDTAARLAAGAIDNMMLVTDAAQAGGLKWIDRDWTPATQVASFNSADAPVATYVMNVLAADLTTRMRPGTRIRIMQTSYKYFIVTDSAFSGGNTQVTMHGGTDFSLLNAAITSLDTSNRRFPPGFPADPTKWNVRVLDGTDKTINNPSQGSWVNPGVAIVVPIGAWELGYEVFVQSSYSGGQGELTDFVTLSTTTSSETDDELTSTAYTGSTNNDMNKFGFDGTRSKPVLLAAKQTFNLLCKANDPSCNAIGFYGSRGGRTVLTAKSLYY